MNCSECRNQLPELLLSELSSNSPPTEFTATKEHLDGCPACREQYATLVDSLASIPLGLEPVDPPEGFSDRVLDRITALRQTGGTEQGNESAPATTNRPVAATRRPSELTTRQRWLSYGLAAGILLTVVGGQWVYLKRMQAVAKVSRDPSEEERLRSLERAVAELRSLQQQTQNPQIRFVSFQSTAEPSVAGSAPQVLAHAVWDPFADQLHFFGFDMKPLPEDQAYAIWFLSPGGPELATTFNTNQEGLANVVASARNRGKKSPPSEIIVTVESHPVSSAPSKKIWCRAQLN